MSSDREILRAAEGRRYRRDGDHLGAALIEGEGPQRRFALDDVKGVAVVFKPAEGRKCARSWKITPEVGSDKEFPDIRRAMRMRCANHGRERHQQEAVRVALGPLLGLGWALRSLRLAIDQVFKWWMLHDLRHRGPAAVELSRPFLDIVLAWNRGISYGWLSGRRLGHGCKPGCWSLARISAGLWLGWPRRHGRLGRRASA